MVGWRSPGGADDEWRERTNAGRARLESINLFVEIFTHCLPIDGIFFCV